MKAGKRKEKTMKEYKVYIDLIRSTYSKYSEKTEKNDFSWNKPPAEQNLKT